MSKAKKSHRQVFEESLAEARRRARYNCPQEPLHGARPMLQERARQAVNNPDRFPKAPEPEI